MVAARNLLIVPECTPPVPELSRKECVQRGQNLLREGCRERICVGEENILDGHDRYEICRRHGISFQTISIDIGSRDAAIAWICATQIGRRNITEETRKYLIGKRYEAEKRLGPPNFQGSNQYLKVVAPPSWGQPPLRMHRNKNKTASMIGREYNVCPNTVQQYGRYAKAVDQIDATCTGFASRMLSGEVKMSVTGAVNLAKMPKPVVQQACDELSRRLDEDMTPLQTHKLLSQFEKIPEEIHLPSVKDMPTYDPDAEINSLAFTIPSWNNTIRRLYSSDKLKEASALAKNKLAMELYRLAGVSEQLAAILKDVK